MVTKGEVGPEDAEGRPRLTTCVTAYLSTYARHYLLNQTGLQLSVKTQLFYIYWNRQNKKNSKGNTSTFNSQLLLSIREFLKSLIALLIP